MLGSTLAPLRVLPYEALVSRFIDASPEVDDMRGQSGACYQLELQGFWDEGHVGPIRIMACIDDGGLRAFKPLCADFIKAPDGSFVGE